MVQHNLIEMVVDHFQAGGETMFPLVFLALTMWTLAIMKTYSFMMDRRQEKSPMACMDIYNKSDGTRLADWQWNIVSGYMENRCEDPQLNREVLDSLRIRQEGRATKHIGTIILLAAVAPLLGLLGTVTGMIMTFDVISQFGTGNARALASGISEALVTTQSGLVVAVPGLLISGFLFRCAEKRKSRMELFCIRLQKQTDDITS